MTTVDFTAFMRTDSARPLTAARLVALTALAAMAVAINVHAPTVFFDVQIMLGACLGVYAILEFGWAGLVVGVAALTVTFVRWKHPFELLIGTGHLIWLKVFLDRFNGGPARQGNGRIVLASIAYWVAVGLPCELLHFTQYFGLDLVKAAGLGLKECVTGVLNASLGFVLYKLRKATSLGPGGTTISARGATFATVLMAVALPGILMTMILSGYLRAAALESHLGRLRSAAAPIAASVIAGESPDERLRDVDGPQVAVQARAVDGSVRSSDPGLFRRLETDYEIETANRTGVAGLDIYAPRGSLPAARVEQVCYWVTPLDAPAGWSSVTAVQSAPHLIRILDHRLLVPLFSLLFGLQIVAAGLAEAIAAFVDGQFRNVLAPVRRSVPDRTMPDLDHATLSELNDMVHLVNGHARRVNELTASVEAARIREQQSEQRQRAELQQKLKTSLTAAAIAHEINLPLSNILLGSKMATDLLTDLDTAADPLRPVLAGLAADSERVVETISRMRMLLRSVQTELGPVDAANIVLNAMLQLDEQLARHGIFARRRGLDVPCIVTGDAGQLQIAVANLVRNAIDAMSGTAEGRRIIDVEVTRPLAGATMPHHAEIVVGDSGPGMVAPPVLGEPLVSTKSEGSGIGLYVVRTIVENHGGELLVGRSPLGGMEFRIRIGTAPAERAVSASH